MSELTLQVSNETNHTLAKQIDDQAKEAYAFSTGTQAVIFLMPLKMHARERRIREQMEAPNPNLPAAPVNHIGHQRRLPRADMVMPYTPNHDTIYSGAALDVSIEPVILTTPTVTDRYWSVQIAGAYIVNLPYLGTRATGGQGGHYALVGPDWEGDLPDGVTLYRIPTYSAMCAVRILVEDEADLPAVHQVQNQFKLTALSQWGKSAENTTPASYNRLPPNNFDGELAWLQDAWQLLQRDRPSAEHAAILKAFESVGLYVDAPFDPDAIDPAFKRGLVRATKSGHDIVRWKAKYRGTQSASYWNVDLVGGSYGFDYLARAEGAVQGLFVHDPEECTYFHTYSDGNNKPLDASKQYRLHFDADQLPPIYEQGFWSITMYKANYQYAANAINRYAIKDRTPGLQYNADGSLDLYIQHTPPLGHESNWLPSAESGIFRLNYRVYLPKPAMLDRQQVEHYLPPVQLV